MDADIGCSMSLTSLPTNAWRSVSPASSKQSMSSTFCPTCSSCAAFPVTSGPTTDLSSSPRLSKLGSPLSAPRLPISSGAVLGRTATSRASTPDQPPLKWSDLRYVFDIKEDCNGKEALQARRDRREAAPGRCSGLAGPGHDGGDPADRCERGDLLSLASRAVEAVRVAAAVLRHAAEQIDHEFSVLQLRILAGDE